MKIRNLVLTSAVAGGILASQFVGLSPVQAGNTYYVGTASGGVWKTTDGAPAYSPLVTEVQAPDDASLLPAIQMARCTSTRC